MIKKQKLLQHIWDDVFRNNYYISYGVPKKLFIKQVKKHLSYDLDINDLKGGKCIKFITNKGHTIIWIWTEQKRLDHLVHECFHAVIYSLQGRISIEDTDEAHAYLIGMLINKMGV